jgi:Na+/H+ antiporter NhaD/arsenite permease-like protein
MNTRESEMSEKGVDFVEMSDRPRHRRARREAISLEEEPKPSPLCKRVSLSFSLGGIVLMVFAALTRDILGKDLAVNLYWASIILILAGIFIYGIWGKQFREPTKADWDRFLDQEIDRSDRLRSQKK